MRKILLFLVLICTLTVPLVFGAGENEYLFDGETVSKIFEVSIGDDNYFVYEVTKNNVIDFTGQNSRDLIVIGPSDYIAEDNEIKNSFFVYYTFRYFTENKDNVESDSQKVGNYIDKNANSLGQTILDLLKKAPELCKKVPKLELIEICVKPSTDSEIMTIISKDIPDWKVALAIFDGLGGKISRLTGPERTALLENAKNIHKYQLTVEDFLTKIKVIDQYPALKSQPLRDFVGSNSNDKFLKLSDRISKLKSTEESKKQELDKLLENVSIDIKEIAKLNGNFSELNSRKTSMIESRKNINLEDKYYTTDINSLDNYLLKTTELGNEASIILDKTRNAHIAKGIFSRAFNRFVGWFKALSL